MSPRKLLISGSLIERFDFSSPPPVRRGKKFDYEEMEKRKEIKKLYNLGIKTPDPTKTASSASRSRARLRRIVFANSYAWKDKKGFLIPPKFLTLTFQDNIQDLKSANYQLTRFIQKINYTFRNSIVGSLQYVCVPEFQKRGAIHYHLLLFNFPFVDRVFKRIRELWPDRFELKTINRKGDLFYISRYISKYITKQSVDGRFWGQKRYFASREIRKSILLKNDIAIELTCQIIDGFRIRDKKIFSVPYFGDITYWTYYIGQERTIYSLYFLDSYAKEQILLADKNKKL
jgi:hypothetical protein